VQVTRDNHDGHSNFTRQELSVRNERRRARCLEDVSPGRVWLFFVAKRACSPVRGPE
jgi:hypothetical protein